jgi:hypothetical protein
MLQATSSRETRNGAREVKFLLSADRGAEVLDWARERLAADPNAAGADGDDYLTTTLYFDTADFAVYRRRGSYQRSKYRIRRYGSAESVFLERKLRTSLMLSKRRTLVPLGDLAALAEPGDDPMWPGRWFEQRLAMRRLSPVSQVSYHRHARVGMGSFGPMRLTFDDGILAQPCTRFGFDPRSGVPVLPAASIVEMKFCVKMPPVFLELVERFNLRPAPLSKYRMSLDALRDAGLRTGLAGQDLQTVLPTLSFSASAGAPIAGA